MRASLVCCWKGCTRLLAIQSRSAILLASASPDNSTRRGWLWTLATPSPQLRASRRRTRADVVSCDVSQRGGRRGAALSCMLYELVSYMPTSIAPACIDAPPLCTARLSAISKSAVFQSSLKRPSPRRATSHAQPASSHRSPLWSGRVIAPETEAPNMFAILV